MRCDLGLSGQSLGDPSGLQLRPVSPAITGSCLILCQVPGQVPRDHFSTSPVLEAISSSGAVSELLFTAGRCCGGRSQPAPRDACD